MAQSNLQKTMNPQVRIKSYLYALRPILCCRWILDRRQRSPVLFQELVEAYLKDTEAGDVIARLLDHKQNTNESDTIPRHAILDEYLADQYERLVKELPDDDTPAVKSVFDKTFRSILDLTERTAGGIA